MTWVVDQWILSLPTELARRLEKATLFTDFENLKLKNACSDRRLFHCSEKVFKSLHAAETEAERVFVNAFVGVRVRES